MNCNDFNADIIPVNEAISPDILQEIKEMEKCGKCLQCLYSYIMLAPVMTDKELIELFSADMLEMDELKGELDELAGFKLNPYP